VNEVGDGMWCGQTKYLVGDFLTFVDETNNPKTVIQ